MIYNNKFFSDVIKHHENILNSSDFFYQTNSEKLTGIVREKKRQDNRPQFLFSEVTGFALLDLLATSGLTGNTQFENRAKEAGEWLCGMVFSGNANSLWRNEGIPSAWQNGWIGCRYYFKEDQNPDFMDSFSSQHIFVFDCAIVLLGLIQLWRRTYDPQLFERIVALGTNLNDLVREDGSVPAIIDHAGNPKAAEEIRWSRQSGAFHAKVAEALAELSCAMIESRKEGMDAEKFKRNACRICDFSLTKQMDNGCFITSYEKDKSEEDPDKKIIKTELHPHMYAAEGLFRVGEILGNRKYIQASIDAVLWALGQIRKKDLIPQQFASKFQESKYRVDAVAQVVCLASQLDQRGLLSHTSTKKLDILAENLFCLQNRETGKFPYGFYDNGNEAMTDSYWTQWFCFEAQIEYLAAQISRRTALVILAGGKGTRCWPISTETRPKPFSYAFLGHMSLIQSTYNRFSGLIKRERTFIVCTPEAEQWARKQLPDLPWNSIVLEPESNGSIKESLNKVLKLLNARNNDTVTSVIVTVADGLFRPYHGFSGAILRATLDQSLITEKIVCIGKNTAAHDSSLGHILFTCKDSKNVHIVEKYVEKPKDDPRQDDSCKDLQMAHDVGCQIWPIKKLEEKLDSTEWEWGRHLEGQKSDLAVSLLSPNTDFLDMGVPGKAAINFFRNTPYDRGNGVVVLGVQEARVTTQFCSNMLVVVDKGLIDAPRNTHIIDIHSQIVLLSDYAWGILILPLEWNKAISGLREMASANLPGDDVAEFCKGGSIHPLSNKTFMIDVKDVNCPLKYGLVCCYKTKSLKIVATKSKILVMGQENTSLDENDASLFFNVTDDMIIRHLLDVCRVGEWLQKRMNFFLPDEYNLLLHRALLYHDIGGVLSGPKQELEREIYDLLKKESRLTLAMDRSVLREILRLKQGKKLTKKLETGLSFLNDSVNSAIAVLANNNIKHLRDELLYLLANQDIGDRFAKDVVKNGLYKNVNSCNQEIENIQKIWAIMQTAEQWACLNSVWRESLADRIKDDVAGGLVFLARQFESAGINPVPYIMAIYAIAHDDTMRKWTEDEMLRSETSQRDFWPSDTLFFKAYNEKINAKDVEKAFDNCKKFDKYSEDAEEYLNRLPKILDFLKKYENSEELPQIIIDRWESLSNEIKRCSQDIAYRRNQTRGS